jgi:hypothetical protein
MSPMDPTLKSVRSGPRTEFFRRVAMGLSPQDSWIFRPTHR